jgi:hypothetical protein
MTDRTEATPTEVSQVFQRMPSRFQPGAVRDRLIYHFSIDGEEWTVVVSAADCEVAAGKGAENPHCFLKTSREIFLGITRGEYKPSLTDFITGRMQSNNPLLLQSFSAAFKRP